ncbi:sterol desaturase family protein [Granulibacter bethesdensis]|uniref:Sterol desaturase family protein n=1 Tax=Granulibacter bethesdensis TaxID=364410 RepID=A0AAN0VG65_9PROT|nr:sterol desaturase family protein [Granulibacter bethesdensis]AHJ63294.1 Sterol desaturase family protein [Granulibacter bethesdensis]AHJ66133.1 Sterol desaturase family protein [Granulibacter bethesdensis CGDNIH4]AHJ68783.1 Sterol desaturase family protein [Granulibacter bethesdensis]APH59750.1 Sterol desaturase family protein [Granulibacter bethesdensis]
MFDPFDSAAGWLQEHLLIPLLWQFNLIEWEDVSYGWALIAMYGVAQVILMYAICVPLEKWRPVERWENNHAVLTDVLYTVISRVGVLPLVSFVGFYQVQVLLNGWLTDHGYVPPTLERFIPSLTGHPYVTFAIYALILDCADYWRHRLSHQFRWWWALHSLHHAQRQMTFWSDDRNHLLDDFISALWFGAIALMIGVPPLQFPLLVLLLRLIESLAHANARISFGRIGDRLLISPRFHRAHHGILAAGQRSCNYGAVFPYWDMLFGTADFSRVYVRTGDPSGEEALHTGTYVQQQMAGLRRFIRSLRKKKPQPS